MSESSSGKFRRKKKEEEESASEWLGVGDDFDAREVGRPAVLGELRDEDDDWNGGAFSNMRARVLGEANGAASDDAAASGPCVCGSVRCSAFVAGRFGFVRFVRFGV